MSAGAPGRTCPVAYRYPPSGFRRVPDLVAETLYVVGGLYGNVDALEEIAAMAAAERGPVAIAFNGDFHWFDIDGADFARIEAGTAHHARIRGNVETEIAGEDSGAGCGCAYPMDVSDAEVARSNEILALLRETARGQPDARAALASLPMNLVARVGELRVGIVHGDASSLAGWGFAHDALANPAHRRWIDSAFRDADVDVFASSHTCLPALDECDVDGARRIVINNGAAGMPNFEATAFGLLTRIATSPSTEHEPLYGRAAGGAHVEALAIRFDEHAWQRRFLASWPEGSPAYASYFRRITRGPRLDLARAA